MQVKKFSELRAKFMRVKRRQAATVLMVVLTVLLVVAAILEFFMIVRITNIVVKGDSPYTYEEILKISEIEKGDFMYSFDKDEIETKVLENAPYIKKVKVSRFFTRLVVKLEADTAKYYIKISDKSSEYYILSNDMRVLECRNNLASIKEEGLIKLELPHLAMCSVGSYIEYSDPDKCGYVKENLDYFFGQDYSDSITAIGLSSRFGDCYVDFYGKCRIILGKPENQEQKIRDAMLIIEEFSKKEGAEYVIINVSDPNKYFWSVPESLD